MPRLTRNQGFIIQNENEFLTSQSTPTLIDIISKFKQMNLPEGLSSQSIKSFGSLNTSSSSIKSSDNINQSPFYIRNLSPKLCNSWQKSYAKEIYKTGSYFSLNSKLNISNTSIDIQSIKKLIDAPILTKEINKDKIRKKLF